VDIGTSSLKAVVYDCQGGVLASTTHRYPSMTQPQQSGWAEADPHAWWDAFIDVIAQLKQTRDDFSNIQAIVLTGQMHTAVLLDKHEDVIPPTILWLDRRAAAETVELQKVFGLPPYQLNSTYTLPKLVWLARNQPEVIRNTRRLLWPKDYLRFRLTGEFLTDYTEAGGAALLDWEHMDWAVDRLEWAGISPSILPPLRQPTDLAGKLLPEIGNQLGLNPDVRVLVGAGDVLALVTAALPAVGRVICSMGSSSMVFYPLAKDQNCNDPQNRIYNYPLLPYRLIGGVSSTSGASITWAAQTLFSDIPFDAALAQALQVSPGAGGLFFLPFLSGERSPYWNDDLRGAYYGLTLNHDRKNMLRAVLEGVSFSLRYLMNVFQQTGVDVNEIALAGGASIIPGLPQILANVCQLPVVIFSGQETVTQGLYAYACQVLEENTTFEQALRRTFQQQPEYIQPDKHTGEVYDSLYHQYSLLADFANDVLRKT
jgi:xylulokinase